MKINKVGKYEVTFDGDKFTRVDNLGKDVGNFVIENFLPIVVQEFKSVAVWKYVLRNLNNNLNALMKTTGTPMAAISDYGINGDGEFFVDIDGSGEELL